MSSQSKLAEAIVRDILLSKLSHRKIAQVHGISYQAAHQIRHGLIHRKTLPDIPRWIVQTHSCESCLHWSDDHCTMDFPEPRENLRFANECNLYTMHQ